MTTICDRPDCGHPLSDHWSISPHPAAEGRCHHIDGLDRCECPYLLDQREEVA